MLILPFAPGHSSSNCSLAPFSLTHSCWGSDHYRYVRPTGLRHSVPLYFHAFSPCFTLRSFLLVRLQVHSMSLSSTLSSLLLNHGNFISNTNFHFQHFHFVFFIVFILLQYPSPLHRCCRPFQQIPGLTYHSYSKVSDNSSMSLLLTVLGAVSSHEHESNSLASLQLF